MFVKVGLLASVDLYYLWLLVGLLETAVVLSVFVCLVGSCCLGATLRACIPVVFADCCVEVFMLYG